MHDPYVLLDLQPATAFFVLFGAQLHMITKLTWLYRQRCIFLKEQFQLSTLHPILSNYSGHYKDERNIQKYSSYFLMVYYVR